MRCYICNRVLEEPQYNRDHEDYDPCNTCLDVIADAVGLRDEPFVGEDALPDEDPLYGLPRGFEDIEEIDDE